MTSPFGPLVLIANPAAGGGRVQAELPKIEEQLRARDLEHRTVLTKGPGDATRAAREAIQGGERFLVAVGGDGTVHEVVNGMLDESGPTVPDAVLGVLAAGSGCDFVRTFGLPDDSVRACGHLEGDGLFAIDVGKVTFRDGDGEPAVRYFPNVAEAGLGAAVVSRSARLPRRLGRSRYFFGFWLCLPRFRPAKVKVRTERKAYEGRAHNVVVANCQYYGGGMRISPRSWPGDGFLDVLVMVGPKSDAFTMLPKIYRGEHLPHRNVVELRARTVDVDADRPFLVEADGEVLGTTPASFEVMPQAIRLKI
jgi:diacylglycerol kinase (ATP)